MKSFFFTYDTENRDIRDNVHLKIHRENAICGHEAKVFKILIWEYETNLFYLACDHHVKGFSSLSLQRRRKLVKKTEKRGKWQMKDLFYMRSVLI